MLETKFDLSSLRKDKKALMVLGVELTLLTFLSGTATTPLVEGFGWRHGCCVPPSRRRSWRCGRRGGAKARRLRTGLASTRNCHEITYASGGREAAALPVVVGHRTTRTIPSSARQAHLPRDLDLA